MTTFELLFPSKKSLERSARLWRRIKANYDYDEDTGTYYPNQKYIQESWDEIIEAFNNSQK